MLVVVVVVVVVVERKTMNRIPLLMIILVWKFRLHKYDDSRKL